MTFCLRCRKLTISAKALRSLLMERILPKLATAARRTIRRRRLDSSIQRVFGYLWGRLTRRMKQPDNQAVTLALGHNGERLTMRRIKTEGGVEELRLTGSLP